MRKLKSSAKTRFVLAAAGLFVAYASGAGEHVVFETNAASYEVGQILEDRAMVTLANNEFLIAISEEGVEVRIDGPFDGVIEDAPPSDIDISDAVAQLFGGPRQALDSLGGIRGGETPTTADDLIDTRPSPWLVHTGVTGDQCVIAGRRAEIWREANAPAGSLEITAAASGRSARIEWRNAAQRTSWPDALPPEEMAVYFIRPVDELRSTAVRLHGLNPALADPSFATVAWMAAKGCVNQARLLLASL